MLESLRSCSIDFHLYIFAFDDLTLKILSSLNLKETTIISLEQFENQELLNVKQGRTKAEYCWTCTSSTILYVLENYNVPDCTYLDADLFFLSSPSVLFEELQSTKTILITEHKYSWFSKMYEEKRAGRFCVQYITFNNEAESKKVLTRWIDQCIEWCFARFENGKFGDQKYLDEWPALYSNVKISEHLGAGVAPWNINQYMLSKNEGSLMGIEKRTGKIFDVIFYHFHFVRFMDNELIDLGWNSISKEVQRTIYSPYIKLLKNIETDLECSFSDYKTKYFNSEPIDFKDSVKKYIKKITAFNLIKVT
jgi:hypothetical protein